MKYEKYYNEKGEVGVIYSPNWGLSWSVWAHKNEREALVFDKRLVEKILVKELTAEFFKTLGYKDKNKYVTDLALEELQIFFVPKGTKFMIDEYDGAENIVLEKDFRIYEA